MGRARFSLQILLVAALIVLCFSNGFARTVLERGEPGDHSSAQVEEEKVGKARMLIQLMDYDEPGPNNNPRTGYLFTPPPPPPQG